MRMLKNRTLILIIGVLFIIFVIIAVGLYTFITNVPNSLDKNASIALSTALNDPDVMEDIKKAVAHIHQKYCQQI